ncbi:MAG TPA: integrin [Planctomycetota bacterium]|nr:integrin [Planctomycetota bacterium]
MQQAYLKASNTDGGDFFGRTIAISGDTVVVGAFEEDSGAVGINGHQGNAYGTGLNSGAAYVFVRSGTTWIQQAYLKASNTAPNARFGCSVAVSGDTIVVGAVGESSVVTGFGGVLLGAYGRQAGAAYVFVRSGSVWSQQALLKASNAGLGDEFGFSVAISGDTIVVGAREEDSGATGVNSDGGNNGSTDSGAAYVFSRIGTQWSQQAYLKASNTDPGDLFGSSVSVSGDTVVVGALEEDGGSSGIGGDPGDDGAENAGAAYVFVRSGTTWAQQAYLKASNTEDAYPFGDKFGGAVAVSGDTLAVGAHFEDSGATGVNGDQLDNTSLDAGAAYVFQRSGSDWSQQAYIKSSNAEHSDNFGRALALTGDTLVVGAALEDSSATGVGGDQSDDGADDSGAAYVFTRSGSSWTQRHYLKASNTGAIDSFGRAVAVSNATVAVGAGWEDSGASGVDGDQLDNSATNSGAAYGFQLQP